MRMQTKQRFQLSGRKKAGQSARAISPWSPRWSGSLWATIALLALFAPGAALAQASMHEVSWAYASPDSVSRFIVYVAATSGDQAGARIMDVGKPAGQPTTGGTMQVFRAIVSAELTEHVAVAAIGTDGTLSPLSAWSPLPPSQPGQPVIIP